MSGQIDLGVSRITHDVLVWNTLADMAEGEARAELLAIRFANSESTLYLAKYFLF